MADYDDPINTFEYKYRKPVYYTNPFPTYQTNLIVKLVLTVNNFNFDLTKDDGSDFRLLEYWTGTGVLKMWNAYWSKTLKHAVLFFKVPDIGGGASVIFTAYWGNSSAPNISDPDAMGFLFYEDFPGASIPTSKWSGSTNNGSSSYGYALLNNSFTTTTEPLLSKKSWIIEAGIYADFSSYSGNSAYRAMGFSFTGSENNFYVDIMHVDRIRHNAIVPGGGSTSTIIKTYGGLEPSSYQDVFLSYYESEDKITVKFLNRNTYSDVEDTIQRGVEGDTRPENVTILGRSSSGGSLSGAYPTYISWFIIREYDSNNISNLDGRDLYIPYANVPPQQQDFREYLPDFTSVIYKHESSFGGNPYTLSDEGYDADSNAWISNLEATVSGAALTIYTGWSEDVTNRKFIHYDSGHEYLYNASKLSDDNEDSMNRNFWQCTTTSGWVAIKFPSLQSIGAFKVRATSNLEACPKDFVFYGSSFNPTYNLDKAVKLTEGTFSQTSDWQFVVFTNSLSYKYYILDIKNTYGDQNIRVQEWEMSPYLGQTNKRYATQLRLHPATYSNWEYNFPTEVSLQGSNNGVFWTTLIPWTQTYTPFVEHYAGYGLWQRYSFANSLGFWFFRLLCRGNWGAQDSKIIIGEWSLHELAEEAYTYRILDGQTNNIQQTWATANCGIDNTYSIFFAANEKINKVANDKLMESEDLPSNYEDFNVV